MAGPCRQGEIAMETSHGVSRRELLQRGGALAAAAVVAPEAAHAVRQAGPNARLGVGFIGCGGRSRAHMEALHWLKEQAREPLDLVAFCDVYRPRLKSAAEAYGGGRTF